MTLQLKTIKNKFNLLEVHCDDVRLGQVFFNGSSWKFKILGESFYAPHIFRSEHEAGLGLLNELHQSRDNA